MRRKFGTAKDETTSIQSASNQLSSANLKSVITTPTISMTPTEQDQESIAELEQRNEEEIKAD